MANEQICTVCKQPYPAGLAACPHCAAAQQAADVIPLDEVDFGAGTDPVSGVSKTSWAEMVGAPGQGDVAGAGATPAVKFDAKSDVDLLKAAQAEKKPPTPALPKAFGAPAGAAPAAGAPADPKATMVGPQGGGPTMMAPKGAGPTMLAPQGQQPFDIPASGGTPSGSAPAAGTPAAGTAGAAKAPGPKATQLSGRQPQPTKVVPQAKPTKVAAQAAKTMVAPPDQQPLEVPSKATAMSGRVAQPTKVAAQAQPTKVVPPASQTQLAPPEEAVLDLPPGSPKATVMSGRMAQETKMVGTPPPTTLTPPKSTQLATPGGLPTKLVPPPQPTQIAPPDQVLPPEDVAESVEAEVDLGAGQPGGTGTSSGELARMMLEQPPAGQSASSAVDLGSSEVIELTATGQLGQIGLEPPKPESEEESSAVDLGSHPSLELPPIGESSKPSKVEGEPGAQPAEGEVNWDQVPETPVAAVEPAPAPAEDQARLSQLATSPLDLTRPKPRYGRRWVAGGILGMILGAVGILAFWVFAGLPPEWRNELRGLVGLPPEAIAVSDGTPSLATALKHLDEGDVDKAWATLNDANFPEEQKTADYRALMGEARWLRYLRSLAPGARPNKEHPEVTAASAELSAVKTARATYWLGTIDEYTGDVNSARQKYLAGRGSNDAPGQRGQKMCEAALDRLSSSADAPVGGGVDLRNHRDADEREQLAQALAVLLVLQVPPAGEEAGFNFWKAAKAAKEGNYDEAVRLLQQAKAEHERMRFQRIKKAQNPTSDPTEEIFLRSCDELMQHWSLLHKLKSGGYDIAALDKVLNDAKANSETLGEVARALKLPADAKKDEYLAKIKDLSAGAKPDEQIDKIRTMLVDKKFLKEDEKDAATGVQNLIKDWEKQKLARADAETSLADIAKALEDAGIKADDPAKGIQDLANANKSLRNFLADMGKQLVDGKFIDVDKPELKDISEGFKKALDKALNPVTLHTSLDPKGMLNIWMSVLALDRSNQEMGVKALNDARRVVSDRTASRDDRAKALAVEGLALRNQGQFAEAQRQLGLSLKTAGPNSPWLNQAQMALRELTDPNAYYLPRAEMYIAYGHPDRAIALADSGLQVFPNNGNLLAQRSLARLDQALRRADGNRITANSAGVAEARQDAEAAVAAGAVVAGNFALGRLAEELGDRAGAERAFRAALGANPTPDQAARLRVALGRVLLQRRAAPPFPAPAPAPAPVENDGKLGRLPGEPRQLAASTDLAAALALLLVLQMGEIPNDPAVDEIIRLAEQAIRQGNAEGHLIKAQALARKGLHNAAVLEYVRGLQKLVRPEYAEGLRQLIDIHPAFNRPEGRQPPDQFMAERHYGAGLHRYHAGQYREAEREFLQAVGCYDQDARYLYYLGLARLAQGYRTYALDDFRTAAELEKQNKPGSAAVSASLERVQGQARQTLNRYRP